MNSAELLPPVPKPPHDPMAWLLDFRAGWREQTLKNLELSRGKGGLVLQPNQGTGRFLAESGGSFGGLVFPPHVALAHDGSVLLLDRKKGWLKRFDPCLCRFEIVPCTGGFGENPRQFSSPGGIGICGGNLFVSDGGNARVQVFSLKGFGLRAIWGQPPLEEGSQPWQPNSVAFDQDGHVLIGDPANGCVHFFTFDGRWLKCWKGVGAVNAIAVDCDNVLYVQSEGEEQISIVDLVSETEMKQQGSPLPLAEKFPDLPFSVTSQGFLVLGSLCLKFGGELSHPPGIFDCSGALVKEPLIMNIPTYPHMGEYLSQPLDSELYRCQWDRIILEGGIPEGSRISVLTYSAETPLPLTLLEGLPDAAWSTNQTVFPGQMKNGSNPWDCMIRSEPGRYLWIKLKFESDGTETPVVNHIKIKFPRISLRRYLPGVFGFDPFAADFTDRFLAIFDQTFRGIEQTLDSQAGLFDPCSAPTGNVRERKDFLSWLASWIGITLDRQWPEERRRLVLKEAGKLFCHRGTFQGLRRMLQLYLGIDPKKNTPQFPPSCGPCTTEDLPKWEPPQLILEHFKLRRWLFLGQGRLGDQAQLWGKTIVNRSQLSGKEVEGNAQLGNTQLKGDQDPFHDPFHVFAHKFTVFVPGRFGKLDGQRKGLERLLEMEKPAQTSHHLHFVEPRFRIGIQSMIGFDSVVGCYPEGVWLNQDHLGRGTILSAKHSGGPRFEVGNEARVGTTSVLN